MCASSWGCYESTVLLDYLEDLGVGTALLPEHPQLKATSRLWVDHVRNIPHQLRYESVGLTADV